MMHLRHTIFLTVLAAFSVDAKQIATVPVFSVAEVTFQGPTQTPRDTPARDVELAVLIRHERGAQHTVWGFWDGDGKGGVTGGVFKVRFAPTLPGKWTLVEVRSSAKQLAGQHQGDTIAATPSKHAGFWIVDPESAGKRWYKRSNGTHPYVVGNTHYSFLSEYGPDGPTGSNIAADIKANAPYFRKVRFAVQGDRYMHPVDKPFLDDEGQPTASGDYSHRPNPAWFHNRTDLAVRTAAEVDLIADLILAGPDTTESRATLRAAHNNGDPAPWLRYVAARYGSYPNVWICLANEYNIRHLPYAVPKIADFGKIIRQFLPYSETPVSVHPWSAVLWEFDNTGDWYDHQIIQKKRRTIASTADFIDEVWRNPKGGAPRMRPTVNDELSYQGDGDKHSEQDSIEAVLGTFLGGGYSSLGHKSGDKLGQYFPGAFNPAEHTAATSVRWLCEAIDANVHFWRMAPDTTAFPALDKDFRAIAWPGEEYVVGTRAAREVVAQLPEGGWTVTQFDAIARTSKVLTTQASGRYAWTPPDSRAVMTIFKRNR